MAIITRASKGSALTHTEMDANLNQIPNGANSAITDNGTNIGIGTSSPIAKLDVLAGADQRLLFTTLGTDPFIGAVNGANSAYKPLQMNGSEIKLMTGGTEKLRILSSGGITFNGDTSTANALDDYEEGTFTPTLCFSDNTVFHTATNQGTYVKVGNLVHVSFRFFNATTTTNTTIMRVRGLPYAAGGNYNNCSTPFAYANQAGGAIRATMYDGNDYIQFDDDDAGLGAVTCNSIGSGFRAYFNMTYTTN